MGFIFVIHITVFGMIILTCNDTYRIALAVLLSISFIYQFRYYGLRSSPRSIIAVHLSDRRQWLLQSRAGLLLEAELQFSSTFYAQLMILNFKIVAKKRRLSVILCPHCLDDETLRRLRVKIFTMRIEKT